MRGKFVHINTRLLEGVLKILFAVSAVFVVFNLAKYGHSSNFHIAVVLAFAGIIVSVYAYISKKLTMLTVRRRYVYLGLSVALVTWQLFFVVNSFVPIGWDVDIIFKAAEHGTFMNYFLRYPNNLLFLMLIKGSYNLVSSFGPVDIWLMADLMNIVMVDVAILFTCLCSYKLFGKKGLDYTFIVSIIILGLSPYLIVPYTDTFGLPFPPILLFLTIQFIVSQKKGAKIALALLYGSVLYMGFLIKPTIAIVGIATFIIVFVKEFKFSWLKSAVFYASIVSVLSGAFALQTVVDSYKPVAIKEAFINGKAYDTEYPMTHFMMMGLKDHHERYGGYDAGDDLFTVGIIGKAEKMEAHKAKIKERLADYGFLGFIKHAVNKYIWFSTDGTFYYGGEGIFITSEPTQTGIRGILENIAYAHISPFQYAMGNFQQAVWLLVLLTLVYMQTSSKKDDRRESVILIAKLAVFGLLLFLVLFEARARYLIPFLPLFILLSTSGYLNIRLGVMNILWQRAAKKMNTTDETI